MARILIAIGLVLVALGLALAFLPRAFAWFGHLPGDVRIETRHGVVFIPLASMLVVSVLGSALLNLVAWIVRKLW
ncbi:MAG TPA: DUF2905 domain-containing protein [Trueperaceae bacterium]|nr:DUF2905 domain-containing protein [Trueperaceae bacterium]